jgi:8-oxo-dGTP pyrophosphatase MutT (NUDIX family)
MRAKAPFDPAPPVEPRPPAIRPRDAATLIIVRRDGQRPRFLMGRRQDSHVFMPGKWVFPGGRVERGDFQAPFTGALNPETERRLVHGSSPPRARAIALAAIRETFEETGLFLGQAASHTPRRAGAWRPFLAHGILPDLSSLEMVARAITPPHSVRRFDVRFLLAPAEALVRLEPEAHCGEFDQIGWVEPDELLALDVANITRFVVSEALERMNTPDKPALFIRTLGRKSRATEI